MEQNEVFKKGQAIIKALEERLAICTNIDGLCEQSIKEAEKEIHEHFAMCFSALASREVAVLKEVTQTIADYKTNMRVKLVESIEACNTIMEGAKMNSSTMGLFIKLLEGIPLPNVFDTRVTTSLPSAILQTIKQHGKVDISSGSLVADNHGTNSSVAVFNQTANATFAHTNAVATSLQTQSPLQDIKSIGVGTPNVTKLNLHACCIQEEGARELAAALIDNTTIDTLILAGNQLGDAGSIAISNLIVNNTFLTDLDLSRNGIGSIGCVSLGEMLSKNSTLTHLDLRDNTLGYDGVQNVMKGTTTNQSLKHLNLSGTNCGSKGTEVIALALQSNSSLSSIDLRDNTIDDDDVDGINALLQTLKINNSTLTTVEISLSKDLHLNSLEALLFLNKEDLSKFKRYIPSETLQLGFKSCVSYIEQLKEAKNKYCSMKVFVIGDPSTGEERLAPFMLGLPESVQRKSANNLYALNVLNDIDASIWDFHEQREYIVAQSFLLSAINSVYLLCFDLRNTERAYNQLATWLRCLHTCLVGTSIVPPLYKIILVGVFDDDEFSFDKLDRLRNSFPALAIPDRYVSVSPRQRVGRDELIKNVTEMCKSVLSNNTQFNIPIAFSSVVPCLPDLRQSENLLTAEEFRYRLHKEKGIEVTTEEFALLLECLHFSGKIYSYKSLVFLDPQLAEVVLTTFTVLIAEHFRTNKNSVALTEAEVREALQRNNATLPLNETIHFLRSTGLCFGTNTMYYFPMMLPTSGNPQFKSLKRAQAGSVGIRFVVAATGYIFSLSLFSGIQTAILESLAEQGEIDFDISSHQMRVASVKFKGELVVVLDKDQLQLHLFVCSTESLERLFNSARQIIDSACDGILPYTSTTTNILKDLEAMQSSHRELALGVGTNMIDDLADDLEDILIPYYSLQIRGKKTIGRGGSRTVKTAEFRATVVTVQQLDMKKASAEDLAYFKEEIKTMRAINSSYVVKLYATCVYPKLAIVMEYLEGGDLSSLLHTQNIELPWQARLTYAEDIASGIAALHNNNPLILHCNLKAANIWLDKDKQHCKLAGFRLAVTNTSESTYVEKGTEQWMAPEILRSQPLLSIFSDMYAFGMILWEIASRKKPFDGVESSTLRFAVVEDHETEEIPEGCPEGYAELIKECWQPQPTARPTATQALAALKNIRQKLEQSLT